MQWSRDQERAERRERRYAKQDWQDEDEPQGTILCLYARHAHFVTNVAWSPDGRYIASTSSDLTIQVWNAMSGGHLYTYRGHFDLGAMENGGSVCSLAWSPDSTRIASAGSDHTVQVWVAY